MEISKEELDYLLQQEYNRGYNAGISKSTTTWIPNYPYYNNGIPDLHKCKWTCDSMARGVKPDND